MKEFHPAIVAIAIVICFCIGLKLAPLLAQERMPNYRPTRSWTITAVDGTRLSVVETAGVCIYISMHFQASYADTVAMAAVPKTQLPMGAGCQ